MGQISYIKTEGECVKHEGQNLWCTAESRAELYAADCDFAGGGTAARYRQFFYE